MRDWETAELVRQGSFPLNGGRRDYDLLVEMCGGARYVLLGEASHGTHEYYRERIRITRRLIEEKGFRAVAVEADWPDAYRVNRFVQGLGPDDDAVDALSGFQRFPSWMWRNADVLDFVGWLRAFNDGLRPGEPKVGFYGLDLYSLFASVQVVVEYLDRTDPEAARRARERYGCFNQFGREAETYGRAASHGWVEPCSQQVLEQLVELQRRGRTGGERDDPLEEDERFHAEQNARLVRSAEQYYRVMYEGSVESWNLRDRHMADMLDQLVAHLERRRGGARAVAWAHNSHLGDARATETGDDGELNVGQLVRERHPGEVVSVGFTGHGGTVTAAHDWGGAAHRMRVQPALEGSFEAVFHATGLPRFMMILGTGEATHALRDRRLERAIGVIYRPSTERVSHYFHADLTRQFDVVIHIDQGRAVEPLERGARWEPTEPPETYPSTL